MKKYKFLFPAIMMIVLLILSSSQSLTTSKYIGMLSDNNHWQLVKSQNSYTSLKNKLSSKAVLAFSTYYYSGDTSSYNSMVANSSLINEIATYGYTIDKLGNLKGLLPANQLTYAKNSGIKALALITNNFDGAISNELLRSPNNKKTLINNIISLLKSNGYKGVNIDLEGVYSYDREYYTTFIKELYETLNPQEFEVTLSIPAKVSDNPSNSWAYPYDYAQLSRYCDKIVLMTYDEHYPGDSPGAVASIGWVENVIKYAISTIPEEKILLGTAAYGYDWSSLGTKAYSISAIYKLAEKYNKNISWDSTSKTPYFNYTDSSGIYHSVWFENSTSLEFKLDLVNKYNLSGIAIWRLGLEDSSYWSTIKSKFDK